MTSSSEASHPTLPALKSPRASSRRRWKLEWARDSCSGSSSPHRRCHWRSPRRCCSPSSRNQKGGPRMDHAMLLSVTATTISSDRARWSRSSCARWFAGCFSTSLARCWGSDCWRPRSSRPQSPSPSQCPPRRRVERPLPPRVRRSGLDDAALALERPCVCSSRVRSAGRW